MKNKKKAFTLTELLVVVIVIGVLSAAVLPKFSKVIETRKTTEAEELMASIRTEQEKRCALDKPYLTDLSNMSEIVKKTDTKNYQLTLQDKGVIASSKGNYSYNLQMPSYADGRICCDGDDCAKLNKNYPSCQGFTYEPSPDSCAGTPPPPDPEPKSCAGTAVTERACTSGCGTEHRTATCNTATGNWEYSAWDNSCTAKPASESRECGTGYTGTQTRSAVCKNGAWEMGDWIGTCTPVKSCDPASKPEGTQSCGNCGTQTRTVTCDTQSGEWKSGSWGSCGGEGECAAGTTENQSCGEGYSGQKTRTCNTQCKWGAWNEDSCGDEMVYMWQDLEQATYNMTLQNSVCYGGAVVPHGYKKDREEVRDTVCSSSDRGRGPHWGLNSCTNKVCDNAHLGDTCYDCANVSRRCNGLPSGGGGRTTDVTAVVMQKKCVYTKKETSGTGTGGCRGRGC